MRSIRLHLTIPDRPAALVYATLADLGHALEGCDGRVVISADPKTEMASEVEANFRRGVLRWGADNTITSGPDAAAVSVSEGQWSCVDAGDGTAVSFAARVDLGLPFSSNARETMAVRALIDDAVAIMSGLFGGDVRVDDVVIQPSEPARSAA